ncbi:MAG TPA: 50S ribosomal protein L29 [Ilumatobacteraceae bacterium]|nr:50S ribosomal protein L29 [Ilumatobacteraceae bacterium]
MAKRSKKSELAELDLAGLINELRATKQEALNLRFRHATGQLENTAALGNTRRQIARINTLIRQKEIAAAEAVQSAK